MNKSQEIQELKDALHKTLTQVEEAARMAEGHPATKDVLQAVEFFRAAIEDKNANKIYLNMIGWAMDIGAVFGVISTVIPVITANTTGEFEIPEEENKDDEQVH